MRFSSEETTHKESKNSDCFQWTPFHNRIQYLIKKREKNDIKNIN